MPAVVRIKRRIDEEPLSSFILNSKKRRRLNELEGAAAVAVPDAGTDIAANEKDGEISTILKFAGTIEEQDDSATTQLARLTKDAAKELMLQKSVRAPTNHTERARQEMRQASNESRFRVVNCMRTTLEGTSSAEPVKEVTIVDIEKQETNDIESSTATMFLPENPSQNIDGNQGVKEEGEVLPSTGGRIAPQSADSDTGYVYDLYLPENELQVEYADMMDDNYLSIHPCDEIFYEDHFNTDESDDSDDSNNENYFTNDYPDEDDDNEDYEDFYDDEEVDALEMSVRQIRIEGYIQHNYEHDDSSVPESEESSDDIYYDDITACSDRHDDDDNDDDDNDDNDGEECDADYYDVDDVSEEESDG